MTATQLAFNKYSDKNKVSSAYLIFSLNRIQPISSLFKSLFHNVPDCSITFPKAEPPL